MDNLAMLLLIIEFFMAVYFILLWIKLDKLHDKLEKMQHIYKSGEGCGRNKTNADMLRAMNDEELARFLLMVRKFLI